MKTAWYIVVLIFACYFAFGFTSWAVDEETQSDAELPDISSQVGELTDDLDLGDLDAYMVELEDYLQEQYGSFDLRSIWNEVKSGNFDFSANTRSSVFLGLLGRKLPVCGALLVQVMLLAILSLFLTNLQEGFGRGVIASYGRSIVFLALIAVAMQAFVLAGSAVSDSLIMMTDMLYAMLPVLLTLMVAMGGVAAVSVFNPAMTLVVGVALSLIRYLVLPLAYGSGALAISAHINPNLSFSKLSKLLRTVGLSILSLILAVFIAILGILGLTGSSLSGISIKAAKSAAGLFIPVVGKSVADLMDTMVGAALILKNCIGLAGVIIIVLICAVPAVEVLLMAWMFKLCGALCEPLGDQRLAGALTDLGSVLMMFFGIVAAAGIFFFFLLLIVLAMGNMSMAIR